MLAEQRLAHSWAKASPQRAHTVESESNIPPGAKSFVFRLGACVQGSTFTCHCHWVSRVKRGGRAELGLGSLPTQFRPTVGVCSYSGGRLGSCRGECVSQAQFRTFRANPSGICYSQAGLKLETQTILKSEECSLSQDRCCHLSRSQVPYL